jgi:hypothetical protein
MSVAVAALLPTDSVAFRLPLVRMSSQEGSAWILAAPVSDSVSAFDAAIAIKIADTNLRGGACLSQLLMRLILLTPSLPSLWSPCSHDCCIRSQA